MAPIKTDILGSTVQNLVARDLCTTALLGGESVVKQQKNQPIKLFFNLKLLLRGRKINRIQIYRSGNQPF